jgi:beta-xylosidase
MLGKQTARGGEPVLLHAKPIGLSPDGSGLPASDDFSNPALGLQWQWESNPQPTWAVISPAEKTLRLSCVALRTNSLWNAGNLLLQKFPAPAFEVTTRLDFAAESESDRAGLIVFGYDYAWIGLRRDGDRTSIVYASCTKAQEGGEEHDLAVLPIVAHSVDLRVTVMAGARCEFAYRVGNAPFIALAASFEAQPAKWVGAKVGLFASAKEKSGSAGHADFSAFVIKAPQP